MLDAAFRTAKALTPEPFARGVNAGFDALARRFPDETWLKLVYWRCHHRWPDFEQPKRFTEKIQALKLSKPDLARFVDKIAVKDFVRERIGEKHVIPTLYEGRQLPADRPWQPPFMIKTSHTSGGNVIVRGDPDWMAIEQQLDRLLALDYSRVSGEAFYSDIEPRILIEPLLGGGELPVDFKLFTFAGVPHFIEVDTDRETVHKRAYFDRDWNELPIRCGYPQEARKIERPHRLAQMLDIAARLGRDFPFVRVDLYEVDAQVYFGELTFAPAAGMKRFDPPEVDLEWGALWPDS